MEDNKYDKAKHLEMIQSNIARLSGKSTAVRGWAISLITAILIFGNKSQDTKIYFYLILAFPLLSFYILDTYYIQVERKFRDLYEEVREGKKNNYELQPEKSPLNILSKGMCSFSQLFFYLPVVVLLLVILLLLAFNF